MTKQNKTYALIIYIIVFYSVWTVFELIIRDLLDDIIVNPTLCQLVKSGIIKNIVWTVPAIILIVRFKDDVDITLKEMFTAKVNWLKYLPIFLIFTVWLLAGAYLQKGQLAISDEFGIDKIIIFLFVGLTEEMVFRGWLLNVTIKKNQKWKHIIINAVTFLLIHFPIWIKTGTFITSFTSFGFLSILALSVIFSLTFIKSRNILVAIALHMYWDLLMFIFY